MKTLHHALETLDLVLLKHAVEKEGVDVNFLGRVNGIEFSPLMSAVCLTWFDGAHFLINAKADVNMRFRDDWTVLQEAVFRPNNAKITRLLLEKGADADARGYFGETALITATTDIFVDSLREICRVTKNLEARNIDGYTALSKAVSYSDRRAAAILLDAGAKTSSVKKEPDWFMVLVAQRRELKQTLIVLFALSRPLVGKDVAKILIAMVWETRDADEWKVETKKSKKVK